MRASSLQQRLAEALGAPPDGNPFFGTFLKGVDPKQVASEMERAIHVALLPRLIMTDHPDDGGALQVDAEASVTLNHVVDWGFPDELETRDLPVSIQMRRFPGGQLHTVHLEWLPGVLAFGTIGIEQLPQVVVFDQPDAVSILEHWLTWSIASFFGEEDE